MTLSCSDRRVTKKEENDMKTMMNSGTTTLKILKGERKQNGGTREKGETERTNELNP
jgi:hypothetical protein